MTIDELIERLKALPKDMGLPTRWRTYDAG